MGETTQPGSQANLDSHREGQIRKWRDAHDLGFVVWMEILPPGPPMPCAAAEAQAGRRYVDSDLPLLPLPGCRREWGCACSVVLANPESPPSTPEVRAALDREFAEAAAGLRRKAVRPPSRGFLDTAMAAFGLRASRG